MKRLPEWLKMFKIPEAFRKFLSTNSKDGIK